jgi:hypothetical protein
VFLTAAHCSVGFWETHAGPYYQSGREYDFNQPPGEYHIGTEYWDAAPWNCGPWYNRDRDKCRESDATMVAFTAGADYRFGTIARTTYYNLGGRTGGHGSTTVDPNNPEFRIIDSEMGLAGGETLDKVGATTGWTYGNLHRGCVDTRTRARSDAILKCQHFATYVAAGGDSGAPVFKWYYNDTVMLYGIHTATVEDGGQEYAVYSGYRSIEHDYGVRDAGRLRTFDLGPR